MDFHEASPADAVVEVTTPILLIHGLKDTNIPPEQSRAIAARNPRNIILWLVPGAGHTGAFATAPAEFRARVLGWFRDHER